jgi:hypothetical protein
MTSVSIPKATTETMDTFVFAFHRHTSGRSNARKLRQCYLKVICCFPGNGRKNTMNVIIVAFVLVNL